MWNFQIYRLQQQFYIKESDQIHKIGFKTFFKTDLSEI